LESLEEITKPRRISETVIFEGPPEFWEAKAPFEYSLIVAGDEDAALNQAIACVDKMQRDLNEIRGDVARTLEALAAGGICTNPDCNYTTEVEPDQTGGWCEECDERSVVSALILAQII
jgi:hypothetical protein